MLPDGRSTIVMQSFRVQPRSRFLSTVTSIIIIIISIMTIQLQHVLEKMVTLS